LFTKVVAFAVAAFTVAVTGTWFVVWVGTIWSTCGGVGGAFAGVAFPTGFAAACSVAFTFSMFGSTAWKVVVAFVAKVSVAFAIFSPNSSLLAIFLTCADAALTLSPAGADFFLIIGGGWIGAVGVEVFVAFVVDIAFAHVSNFVTRTFTLAAARIITASSTCKLLSLLSSIEYP